MSCEGKSNGLDSQSRSCFSLAYERDGRPVRDLARARVGPQRDRRRVHEDLREDWSANVREFHGAGDPDARAQDQEGSHHQARWPMTLYERLKVYTLGREWSANKQDGNGPRCPECDALRTSVEHGPDCEVGKLCDH